MPSCSRVRSLTETGRANSDIADSLLRQAGGSSDQAARVIGMPRLNRFLIIFHEGREAMCVAKPLLVAPGDAQHVELCGSRLGRRLCQDVAMACHCVISPAWRSRNP